jgi:hypothetical protein
MKGIELSSDESIIKYGVTIGQLCILAYSVLSKTNRMSLMKMIFRTFVPSSTKHS